MLQLVWAGAVCCAFEVQQCAVIRPRSDHKCASAGEDYCVTGESGEQCQPIIISGGNNV